MRKTVLKFLGYLGRIGGIIKFGSFLLVTGYAGYALISKKKKEKEEEERIEGEEKIGEEQLQE
ncbi:MAG: hypothetical protein D6828_05505 [Nitrospirae bacterium]|nr:MAG: hypothetical protein D6828_05505 [Nitrospirota bacterium]